MSIIVAEARPSGGFDGSFWLIILVKWLLIIVYSYNGLYSTYISASAKR